MEQNAESVCNSETKPKTSKKFHTCASCLACWVNVLILASTGILGGKMRKCWREVLGPTGKGCWAWVST